MNSIRQIQELNRRELENNVYIPPHSFQRPPANKQQNRSPNASWHADYRDTAYIYIGGLPFELSEGDVMTIFSQYGEPSYINLIRDKETGKSRGFAFLKYEDQRSTDLAVDNLGGVKIMDRVLKVDHTRYKRKEDEEEKGMVFTGAEGQGEDGFGDGEGRRKRRRTTESEEEERPMLKEERELAKLIQEHDEDDPMKAFLLEEKKEDVAMALAGIKGGKEGDSKKSHKHRHHHRSRREKDDGDDGRDSRRRHTKDRGDRERTRSRSLNDTKERDRRSRPSDNDRSEGRKDRRRSARRDSRHRDREERDRDSGRSRRGDDSRRDS